MSKHTSATNTHGDRGFLRNGLRAWKARPVFFCYVNPGSPGYPPLLAKVQQIQLILGNQSPYCRTVQSSKTELFFVCTTYPISNYFRISLLHANNNTGPLKLLRARGFLLHTFRRYLTKYIGLQVYKLHAQIQLLAELPVKVSSW